MDHQCNRCNKSFQTYSDLYNHQESHKPKIVLMSHDHHGKSDNRYLGDSGTDADYLTDRKRKNLEDINPKAKKDIIAEDSDENNRPVNLRPVNVRQKPKKYKRKGHKRKPYGLENAKEPIHDDFKITDEYIRSDSEIGSDLEVLDEYVAPSIPEPNRNYYKQKYEQCLEDKHEMKVKYTKLNDKFNESLKNNADMEKKLETLETSNEESLKIMESECEKKLQELRDEHENDLKKIDEETKEKIRHYQNQIKAFEQDDTEKSSLSKIFYSCTTMEEIFEIKKLIENHQIDSLLRRHVKTLQKLLISLSMGILPICQPQRERLTDHQTELITKIQSGNPSSVKKLITENRSELVSLFEIIKDSIKLARSSYNKLEADRRL